jgi:hypothetical protein
LKVTSSKLGSRPSAQSAFVRPLLQPVLSTPSPTYSLLAASATDLTPLSLRATGNINPSPSPHCHRRSTHRALRLRRALQCPPYWDSLRAPGRSILLRSTCLIRRPRAPLDGHEPDSPAPAPKWSAPRRACLQCKTSSRHQPDQRCIDCRQPWRARYARRGRGARR